MLLQVTLHPESVTFGGLNEYPDGQIGQEGVPPQIVEMVRQEGHSDTDTFSARVMTAYEESAPRLNERLRYVVFREHFVGMTAGERPRPKRKTDDYKGMWIPEWLLVPVQEVSEATAS